jgi:hypothetical protein
MGAACRDAAGGMGAACRDAAGGMGLPLLPDSLPLLLLLPPEDQRAPHNGSTV